MRMSIPIAAAIGSAAIALLAGCSGSGTQAANGNPLPNGIFAASSQKAGTSSLVTYLSDFDGNSVTAFDQNGNVVRQIGGLAGPEGIFIDSNHNLWVSNREQSNVLEFAPGATSPTMTLSDSNNGPADVTVCPNGTVYVANVTTGFSGGGSIEAYAAGSSNPTGTLTDPSESSNDGVACDVAGNVFSTIVTNRGSGAVIEYAGGVQSGFRTLPIRLSANPGAIKPDNAGNLLVADQSTHTITEFSEAGTRTGKSISTGSASIFDFAVAKNRNLVGGTDDRRGGVGIEWTFPGGKIQQTFTPPNRSRLIGFAFDPGL